MKKRIEVPPRTAAKVQFLSDRTCCVCRVAGRPTQIHHLDEVPSNHDIDNLALLCCICHDETTIKGGFSRRKLTAELVICYRDGWHRIVAIKLAQAPPDRDGTPYRKRAFRAFIRSVQCDLDILMSNWKHTHPGNPHFLYNWQKETATKVAAKCADILEDIPADNRAAFMELLMHFSCQGRRDVEPYEGKQPDKPLLYSDRQKKLRGILEGMVDYAK